MAPTPPARAFYKAYKDEVRLLVEHVPSGIRPGVGYTLAVLRFIANGHGGGRIDATIEEIAELVGLAPRTVRRYLAVLETLGIVSRDQPRVGGGAFDAVLLVLNDGLDRWPSTATGADGSPKPSSDLESHTDATPTVGLQTVSGASCFLKPSPETPSLPDAALTVGRERPRDFLYKEHKEQDTARARADGEVLSNGLTRRLFDAMTLAAKGKEKFEANPNRAVAFTRRLSETYGEDRSYAGLLWVTSRADVQDPFAYLEKLLRDGTDPWASVGTQMRPTNTDPLLAWAATVPAWCELTSISSRSAQEGWMRRRLQTDVPGLEFDVTGMTPLQFLIRVYRHLGREIPVPIPADA